MAELSEGLTVCHDCEVILTFELHVVQEIGTGIDCGDTPEMDAFPFIDAVDSFILDLGWDG